jgi:hypothetical protein
LRHSEYRYLRLVKVGRVGGREAAFREQTLRLLRDLGLESSVDLVGHIADEDLPAYCSGTGGRRLAARHATPVPRNTPAIAAA